MGDEVKATRGPVTGLAEYSAKLQLWCLINSIDKSSFVGVTRQLFVKNRFTLQIAILQNLPF